MNKVSLRSLTFMLLVAFLVWSSTFEACNARRGKHWRQRTASASLYNKKGKTYGSSKHNHNGGSSKPKPPPEKVPLPPPVPTPTDDTPSRTTPAGKGYSSGHSSTFNVIDFGAKGDGITDDTKAFQAAWIAACKVEASMITVPADAIFLVGPISFSGPYCQANLVFQLDGTIIAPTDYKTWSKGLLQWLEFTKLRGITIQGTGIIDGRGSSRWEDSPLDDPIDDESNSLSQ